MLSRRRFLFLLGGGATGVWVASTGLIRLERRFVLALGGACSFCGKAQREVRTLLGTLDRSVQVCDECVDLCMRIIAEETAEQPRPSPPPPPRIVVDDPGDTDLVERLRRLAEERNAERAEALLADARRAFERRPTRFPEFHCSFCDAPRAEVRKLISGPRVFICDACVADAAAVVGHVLRG